MTPMQKPDTTPLRAALVRRMELWMAAHMPWIWLRCEQFQQGASAALDGRLPAWLRVKMGLHRMACRACRKQERYLGQLRQLAKSPLDEPVALPPATEERLRAALRAAEQQRRNADDQRLALADSGPGDARGAR
ncbi:MAG: hypothetical protein HY902_03410 [Deltaproteobacteria bacterium]|nr:hypothetical protein [Deltaproteobacteria bacterium]